MRHKAHGFTIVELLIVIVVIGVLAAIVIVAYNGIQVRARVGTVTSSIKELEKTLALYYIDNDAYPDCSGAAYVPGASVGSCNVASLSASLVPKYVNSLPIDTINVSVAYFFGTRKVGPSSYMNDRSNNYVLTSWLADNSLYLSGSNN